MQNSVGLAMLQAGMADEGLDALKRAVALAPRHPSFALDLAGACVRRDQLAFARSVLRQSLATNPNDRRLPVALARLEEAFQDWPQAATLYAQAIALDAGNAVWYRCRARCLHRIGEHEAACRCFDRARSLNASTLSIADMICFGDSCFRTQRLDLAQSIYDEVARTSPRRIREVELLRGLCAMKRKEGDLATGILSAALLHWPNDADLNGALQLCSAKNAAVQMASAVRQPGPTIIPVVNAQPLKAPRAPTAVAVREPPIRAHRPALEVDGAGFATEWFGPID